MELNCGFISVVPKLSSRCIHRDLTLVHHLKNKISLRNFTFIASKGIPPMLLNHIVLLCITDLNYLKVGFRLYCEKDCPDRQLCRRTLESIFLQNSEQNSDSGQNRDRKNPDSGQRQDKSVRIKTDNR